MSDKKIDKQQMADMVAKWIHDGCRAMIVDEGYPIEAVLAGAHAGVVAAMIEIIGGPATAERCKQAAGRAQHMPSAAAYSLAVAPPAGRA